MSRNAEAAHAYDDDLLLAMVNNVQRHEDFWSDLGAHHTATSEIGKHLRAFYREIWDRWAANVTLLAAAELTRDQRAQLLYNVGQQLPQIRFTASTTYQLPIPSEYA